MIPVEPFISPAVGSREYNAVKKALKEKPSVEICASDEGFYAVKGQYEVHVWSDSDQQHFVECQCPAGTPPIDPETLLPTREASPCYHAAAVLLHIAENNSEGESIPFEQRRENVSSTPS